MSDAEQQLGRALWDLGNVSGDLVQKAVEQSQVRKTRRTYIIHRVDAKTFDYSKEGYAATTSLEDEEEWTNLTLAGFVHETVRVTAQFDRAMKILASEQSVDEPRAGEWLRIFVLKAIQDPARPARDAHLSGLIATFVKELHKGTLSWRGIAWLDGVKLEQDSVKIGNGVVLRQTKASDLDYRESFDLFSVVLPSERPSHHDYPSAILEVEVRGDSRAVAREVIRTTLLLRLFKVASASYIWIETSSNGILHAGSKGKPPLSPLNHFRETLTKTELSRLPKFFETFGPLIPDDLLADMPSGVGFIGNASMRYNDALLSSQSVEARIAASMMALETLLLKTDEREELSERLALRAAKLLYLIGKRPVEVYQQIKQGYEVRSQFVHGGSFGQEQRANNDKLIRNVANHARLVILLFMYWKLAGEEKDKRIALITHALLDRDAEDKLRKSLGEDWDTLFA